MDLCRAYDESGEDERPQKPVEVTPLREGVLRVVSEVAGLGVSFRLKLQRLARRAYGSHGAGGAVVARTAGCRHPPSASVQGNPDARPSHSRSWRQLGISVPWKVSSGSLLSSRPEDSRFAYLAN